MEKKVALVTGGTGGIGTAICQQLSKDGYIILATYFKGGDHAAVSEWQKVQAVNGHQIKLYFANVNDFNDCQKLIDNISNDYCSIDVLVNNAGITRDSQLYKMDAAKWDEVISTNLTGVFNVTRNVIEGMMNRQYGRIINISSINGQMGQFGQANYAAAKAGLHGFTKSVARESAKYGITVNTVSPGYIETSMLASISNDMRAKIISNIPVQRLGRPDEVARVVSFLASPDSAFITGSNIMINGGQYLL